MWTKNFVDVGREVSFGSTRTQIVNWVWHCQCEWASPQLKRWSGHKPAEDVALASRESMRWAMTHQTKIKNT